MHDAGGVLEVHLMIERPERHVAEFAQRRGRRDHVHPEATPHLHYALGQIREAGCRAGAAINPATPPEALAEVADLLDVALCMTVNPGWGGQPFIEHSLDKIRRLRALLPEAVALEVDGGIDPETAGPCAEAGATSLRRRLARLRRAGPGGRIPRRSRRPRALLSARDERRFG